MRVRESRPARHRNRRNSGDVRASARRAAEQRASKRYLGARRCSAAAVRRPQLFDCDGAFCPASFAGSTCGAERDAASLPAGRTHSDRRQRAFPVESRRLQCHGTAARSVACARHAGGGTPRSASQRRIRRASGRVLSVEGELEGLLSRSFPKPGDADRIRRIFEDSLSNDALDMATHRDDGKIYFSFPVAILAAENPRRSGVI